MGINIVFTLSGTDRVGIVDEITRSLLELGGNIESSRMARLGGEFAVLMLVSLPADKGEELQKTVADLTSRGYKVTTTVTNHNGIETHPGWLPYRIEVHGADHEGIVNNIAHALAQQGISIESMDTGNSRAPNSGALLFTMKALILVPPGLDEHRWQEELENIGLDQHVDITFSPNTDTLV
ncbi:MAG: ACT domain-containing protein [Pseudomonadota bacterium]